MTEQRQSAFLTKITPIAGWFVTVGHPLVQQRFYAAIDSTGSLCWTDDRAGAAQFPLRQDAERFAEQLCAEDDWDVTR